MRVLGRSMARPLLAQSIVAPFMWRDQSPAPVEGDTGVVEHPV